MKIEMLRKALCGTFEIGEEAGTLLVRTPFAVDFNDSLVLRVRPSGAGYRVDDNGETLLALSFAGADPEDDRILDAVEPVGDVLFEQDDGVLSACASSVEGVAESLLKLIAAALRVHAACRPRPRVPASDLKERVVRLLQEVAREQQVAFFTDQTVEKNGSIVADAVLGELDPLIVFAATSVERLMEAELLYLRQKLNRRSGYVCAVVPSAQSIGRKHYSRANYYTDKTVEFDGWTEAFREFASSQVGGRPH